MTNQQLTLLDAPDNTPSTQWELENKDACDHQWLRTSDHLGLFCWQCARCRETKKADPIADRQVILRHAEIREEKFLNYAFKATNATTKADKVKYYGLAQHYYWRAKISYLRVGDNRLVTWGDFELAYPCPPELLPIYEILTQKPPLNDLGKLSDDEVMDTSPIIARGKTEDPQGTLTQITPSNKKRRAKGEGSGYLFSRQVNRKGKTYVQWWFQYEEVNGGAKRKKKSVYVPQSKLPTITELNQAKVAVVKILEALGKSPQT